MKKIAAIALIVFSFFNLTCKAPRDNPLDSEAENAAVIEGTVQSFSLPYTPLRDVSVYWAVSNSLVKTDGEGRFTILNALKVNGYLLFSKPGYSTDSVLVDWDDTKKITVHVNLNKIPVLDSAFIFTTVINHADLTRSFELTAIVRITDEDKDIDSVIVENKKLNIRKPLEYDIIKKTYQFSLQSDEITMNDVEDTIGEDFTFFVIDLFGKLYEVGKDQVSRVIRTGAEAVSPNNLAQTDSLPVFRWSNFQPGYSLTYTVDIYKNDPVNPQLVFRNSGMSISDTSMQINEPLPQAEYFWVIWTVDSFRNSSRSKPANFIVR